MSRKDNSQTTL